MFILNKFKNILKIWNGNKIMKVFSLRELTVNGTDKTHDYFVFINYIRYHLLNYNSNFFKGILYVTSVSN